MSSPAIHLLLTRRGPVWRVRILIPGQPRPYWRAYRVAEYPTPETVVRRCVAGLARRGKDEDHDDNDAESNEHVKHEGPLLVRWEFQPWLWA